MGKRRRPKTPPGSKGEASRGRKEKHQGFSIKKKHAGEGEGEKKGLRRCSRTNVSLAEKKYSTGVDIIKGRGEGARRRGCDRASMSLTTRRSIRGGIQGSVLG